MRPEYETIGAQLRQCIEYLAKEGNLKPGATVVLGCSTSEVAGGLIGKNSVPELGDAIAETMIETCQTYAHQRRRGGAFRRPSSMQTRKASCAARPR